MATYNYAKSLVSQVIKQIGDIKEDFIPSITDSVQIACKDIVDEVKREYDATIDEANEAANSRVGQIYGLSGKRKIGSWTPYSKEYVVKVMRVASESKNTSSKFSIVVKGTDAIWAEFGSGVHFNGAGMYPDWRAAQGVVGIGEFMTYGTSRSMSKGVNDYWIVASDDKNVFVTNGIRATYSLYRRRLEFNKYFTEALNRTRHTYAYKSNASRKVTLDIKL